MSTSSEVLARLRHHNISVRALDRELAEEGLSRGATSEIVEEGMHPEDVDAGIVEESIVMRRERPVLAIKNDMVELKFASAEDSQIWRERLARAAPYLSIAIPAVGRIDLKHGRMDWVGTGWLVREDTIVTNRHVAREFVTRGSDELMFMMDIDAQISASVDFLQEIDNDRRLVFKLVRPLHIEPSPGPDVAFFEIEMTSGNARLARPITLAKKISATQNVATIGYPARDSRIPDAELMQHIYGGVYDKKRLAPGGITEIREMLLLHNCTTLGGNSGSAVVDLDNGEALGLHFSGRFLDTNYAVRADIVHRILDGICGV